MALETDKRWKMFLFSSIGSVSAEAATVPIDVVKVSHVEATPCSTQRSVRPLSRAQPLRAIKVVSCKLTRCICVTSQVRLQLQGELGAVRQYNGILDAFVKIVKSEGIGALYKGISPALLRQSTYGGARIGLYEVSCAARERGALARRLTRRSPRVDAACQGAHDARGGQAARGR